MKVLSLRCANEHLFEGWFASDGDFKSQGDRGLLACPLCNDTEILRLPSAPRLNVSRPQEPARADSASTAEASSQAQQAKWLRAVRQVIKNTEDVGERFPEEARRIHYGEAQERAIRGHASPADTDALREEGIQVMSVAVPEPFKGPLQ